MSRFTPKYRGYERSALLLNARGECVAEVFTDKEPGDQYETAAMFAAAPELLEALKVAHGVILWAADHGADERAIVEIEAMARESIAKAEGQQ